MQDLVYKHLWQQEKVSNDHEQQLGYEVNVEELLIYRSRLYVPNQKHLKNLVLDEFHMIPYAGHPRYHKMISSLRKEFSWLAMTKEVAEYLAICLECQQIKAEHQHLACLLHPLLMPEWKWETISIDSITEIPK